MTDTNEQKFEKLILNTLTNKIKRKFYCEIEEQFNEFKLKSSKNYSFRLFVNNKHIHSIHYRELQQTENKDTLDLYYIIDNIPASKFIDSLLLGAENTYCSINVELVHHGKLIKLKL